MARSVKIRLTGSASRQAGKAIAQAINDYLKDINVSTQTFVNELADTGRQTSVTVTNGTKYAGHIDYNVVEDTATGKEHKAVLNARSEDVESVWYTSYGEKRSEPINPLLMAEFGSGFENVATTGNSQSFHEEAKDLGMVQGSLKPNHGHAFDPDGWGYYDESMHLHLTKGEPPITPMFHAYMKMTNPSTLDSLKRGVFDS